MYYEAASLCGGAPGSLEENEPRATHFQAQNTVNYDNTVYDSVENILLQKKSHGEKREQF
jgi:hypothetical protein